MAEIQFWFPFREAPDKAISASGPYTDYKKALAAAKLEEARHCEVSAPYQASSREEAQIIAERRLE